MRHFTLICIGLIALIVLTDSKAVHTTGAPGDAGGKAIRIGKAIKKDAKDKDHKGGAAGGDKKELFKDTPDLKGLAAGGGKANLLSGITDLVGEILGKGPAPKA